MNPIVMPLIERRFNSFPQVITTYIVRVDDSRTVEMSGDADDLDQILVCIRGYAGIRAELAAASAEAAELRDALQDWQVAAGMRRDKLDAAMAEISEMRVQIKGLQLSTGPGFTPDVEALTILLARQEVRANDAEANLAAARAELDAIRKALGGYPDSDLISLAQTVHVRSEALDAARAELDECQKDVAFNFDRMETALAERNAARADADAYRSMVDSCRARNKELGVQVEQLHDELAECRAERARYGDIMTSRLGEAEAQLDAARAASTRGIKDWSPSLFRTLVNALTRQDDDR